MLAGANLRTICVSTYLSASPRIDFVLRFCSYVSFFGNYVVAFKAGPRLRRDFLSFCELFLFTTFIYTFCVFLVIIWWWISLAEFIIRHFLFFSIPNNHFGSISVWEEVFSLWRTQSSGIFGSLYSLLSFKAFIFLQTRNRRSCSRLIAVSNRMMFDCGLTCFWNSLALTFPRKTSDFGAICYSWWKVVIFWQTTYHPKILTSSLLEFLVISFSPHTPWAELMRCKFFSVWNDLWCWLNQESDRSGLWRLRCSCVDQWPYCSTLLNYNYENEISGRMVLFPVCWWQAKA